METAMVVLCAEAVVLLSFDVSRLLCWPSFFRSFFQIFNPIVVFIQLEFSIEYKGSKQGSCRDPTRLKQEDPQARSKSPRVATLLMVTAHTSPAITD